MESGLPSVWTQDFPSYNTEEVPIESIITDDFPSSTGKGQYTYGTSVDPIRPFLSYNTQRSTQSLIKERPLLTLGEQTVNLSQYFEVDQSSPSSFGSSPYSALSQNRDFFPPVNDVEQECQWVASEVPAASPTVGIDAHANLSIVATYTFGEELNHLAPPYISENVHRHSDIMPDDKRNLLTLLGLHSISHDPSEISLQFSEQLYGSLTNTIHPSMHMQSRTLGLTRPWGKPTKANVSSEAGKVASEIRRKVQATFFCELRETCGASFTRKNGLINHYKAHLGITDKHCQFCGQAFTTSVGRHEKKCKQNPAQSQKQSLILMGTTPYY